MSFANVAEQLILGFCNSVILIIYPFIGRITFEMPPRNPILEFVPLSSMFVGACIKGSIKGFKIKFGNIIVEI